jgi:hypothetical protein
MDEITVQMAQAVGRVEAGIQELLRMNGVQSERIGALESRVDAVERAKWKVTGAVSALGVIAGAVGRFIFGA